MKYILWLGTKENPKAQKHRPYDTEEEIDKMIEKLQGLFPNIELTKEKYDEHSEDHI